MSNQKPVVPELSQGYEFLEPGEIPTPTDEWTWKTPGSAPLNWFPFDPVDFEKTKAPDPVAFLHHARWFRRKISNASEAIKGGPPRHPGEWWELADPVIVREGDFYFNRLNGDWLEAPENHIGKTVHEGLYGLGEDVRAFRRLTKPEVGHPFRSSPVLNVTDQLRSIARLMIFESELLCRQAEHGAPELEVLATHFRKLSEDVLRSVAPDDSSTISGELLFRKRMRIKEADGEHRLIMLEGETCQFRAQLALDKESTAELAKAIYREVEVIILDRTQHEGVKE